jgi:cobalt/nickel transport system permease protein
VGTDKYAYRSKLRNVEPRAKLAVALAGVAVCLALGSAAVNLLTVFLLNAMSVKLGGIRPRALLRRLGVPFWFLAVAAATADWRRAPDLFLRAMAVVSCVYFFALNTPVTDFAAALRRLRAPALFVELTELVYRFVFVLADAAGRVRTAQTARLGYRDVRTAYRSLGVLASVVLLRAYRKSDRVNDALTARGYGGALGAAGRAYESGRGVAAAGAAAVCAQLAAWALERTVL